MRRRGFLGALFGLAAATTAKLSPFGSALGVMPGQAVSSEVGEYREDLLDMITIISPSETPLFDFGGRGFEHVLAEPASLDWMEDGD